MHDAVKLRKAVQEVREKAYPGLPEQLVDEVLDIEIKHAGEHDVALTMVRAAVRKYAAPAGAV